MFDRVLIANRGEIACRIIRACHQMGLEAVAIYSQADKESRHVHMADRAICIGAGSNADSYLNLANILMACEISGAQAVHPGYGYNSERSAFVQALESIGVAFVGPSAAAIEAMGDKARAKQAAIGAQCPVVPGSPGEVANDAEAQKVADAIGYPVLLKAVAGGGGRGIRRVNNAEELTRAWKTCQAEAQASFGNGDLIVEKCVVNPRHVEVQILADQHGRCLYIGERECSVQNLRHQKIVEEAPCAVLSDELRREMGAAAVRVAQSVGYTNAGTVEFLLGADGRFYFLEMNTRIQVEHPVTEEISGLDLVQWQLRIAAGEKLPFRQEDVRLSGHSIEARITAQDPDDDFAPSTGRITRWDAPGFGKVRLDTHVYAGFEIMPFYDPMIAKLVVTGRTREEAVKLLGIALDEFHVEGVKTNIPFLRRLVRHSDYLSGNVNTGFVPRFLEESEAAAIDEAMATAGT